MYACLHLPSTPDNSGQLFKLALQFSPQVEQFTKDTVVISIGPLRQLLGTPHQIASAISCFGYEQKVIVPLKFCK